LTSTITVFFMSEGTGLGGAIGKPIPESDGGSTKTGPVAVVDWLLAGVGAAAGLRRSTPPGGAVDEVEAPPSVDVGVTRGFMMRGPPLPTHGSGPPIDSLRESAPDVLDPILI
jgi:hypothetical protein